MQFFNSTINCSLFDVIAKSAVKVAIQNFTWQYSSLILFNPAFYCGVAIFLEFYDKSVIIGKSTFNPWLVEHTKQFVLFLSDLSDLENFLEWLKIQRFNNTGKYIIVCSTIAECDETRAVNLLWEYKMTNVVFIKYDKLRTPIAFTYFQDSNCRNSPPLVVDHWSACLGSSENCTDMFPIKFTNLQQCPLIVSTFEQTPYMLLENGIPAGSDGDLLLDIITALNASLIITTPKIGEGWGKLEENGTWSGSLGDVYYDWANFSMTSASITLHRYSYFQMSKDYNTVTLVWVTHPSSPELSLFKVFRPYKKEAVIFICLIYLLVSITLVLYLKNKSRKSLKKKIKSDYMSEGIMFHSWEICIGLPASKLPEKWLLLYFTLLWIFNCFLLRTLYQVHLISSLQTVVRIKGFESIEEAINEGYPFGGGLALKDYYIDYPVIYDNYQNVESSKIYPTLVELSQEFKFVAAVNFETTRVFLRKPNRKLHILPQRILNSPTGIFYKKYSCLAQSVDQILTRLIESGIVRKIYQDNTFLRNDVDKDAPKKISFQDYAGCFMILGGGWIASLGLFAIERFKYYKREKKSMQIIIK